VPYGGGRERLHFHGLSQEVSSPAAFGGKIISAEGEGVMAFATERDGTIKQEGDVT
jgi:hypothetical protein